MKYVLWTLQVLLALAFLGAGVSKVIQPYAALAERMVWVGDVPEPLVRFIGMAELLGALGLLLPAGTRVLPWLTPLAAAGLALDMFLASWFHLLRFEYGNAVQNAVLMSLAASMAYGRTFLVPIRTRRRSEPGHPRL